MAQIVSFQCVLKNRLGKIISTTINRDVVTAAEPGAENMLQGLAPKLQNLRHGETRSISLTAPEAYGFYDPRKVILYPRRMLPRNLPLVKGGPVTIVTKAGQRRGYRVVEVHKDMVLLDGNHPLAGQDLIFEIEILSVREATAAEMEETSNSLSQQGMH